ncbi:MAG: Holliday junction branch migration protein RuvA [Chlamydiae bacterium CG10_big_fil_rev_8_21_14_0_10_35_9]|nr:MAG: Holliday junction branch migration protein RuvA [Chlamydiae bacterium CG10_big_fil_rev_8_21_14_0_10_35_9]
MYEYIKGTLEIKTPHYVVLDVSGVGYKIMTPSHMFSKLTDLGGQLKLYTSFIVKEDEQTLYGFLKPEEKKLFELVISVSGIGPKLGLTIIGHLDEEAFYEAIATANVKLISKIPGIGKKTSERLILEMKDKLKNHLVSISSENSDNHIGKDLLNALINLGYHPMKAQKAAKLVQKENPEMKDLAQLITLALRKI